jgi:hypothetical protein
MNPERIVLRGKAGEKIAATATLYPAEKYQFKIIDGKLKSGKEVSFSWKIHKDKNSVGYLLTVTNLKKEKGRYVNQIVLKTDSPILPEIPVVIYGNIL